MTRPVTRDHDMTTPGLEVDEFEELFVFLSESMPPCDHA